MSKDPPTVNQPPSTRNRSKAIAVVLVLLIVAIPFAAIHWMRAPIRKAQKIQTGDDLSVATKLLGSPTLEFTTNAELMASDLGRSSFVFTDVMNDSFSDLPAASLPKIEQRAIWFEYSPTAGHLIYLDQNDSVELVLWGGT